MTEENVGAELIRRGWNQGSLIRAASLPVPYLGWAVAGEGEAQMSGLAASEPVGGWGLQQGSLGEDEYLVIVSHVCDLARAPTDERYVEAVRAFWTTDRSVIHQARTNSLRRFLLREPIVGDPGQGALIADATARVLVESERVRAPTRRLHAD